MEQQMNNEKRCMNSAKNTVEKRAQIDDWEKIKINNKKSDEQYILNKPKVLQLLHIHLTSITTFSQKIYFKL